MRLQNVIGLDHVVMLVESLDAAADNWRRLGFTLSPRGTHSPHLGSGNYTIMLDPDYIELLGILTETPHNAPSRGFLEQRGEGMERAAFTARDAAAGVAEIRAMGLDGIGPIDFGRPVALPGGGETEARFRVFQWPVTEAPGGLRIFACQHLTREAVWIPELQHHANTARRILRVEIVARDPEAAAAHMARLIAGEATRQDDGTLRVPSGSDRADFLFQNRETLARRFPEMSLAGLAAEGAAALVLAADSMSAAAEAVGELGTARDGRVCVPPLHANGIILAFQER